MERETLVELRGHRPASLAAMRARGDAHAVQRLDSPSLYQPLTSDLC